MLADFESDIASYAEKFGPTAAGPSLIGGLALLITTWELINDKVLINADLMLAKSSARGLRLPSAA